MRRSTVRRFVRTCRPLHLGQVPAGFFLAASLIFLFQFAQPAKAVTTSGYSENDYFRIDWEYDLTAGTGSLYLKATDSYYTDIYLNTFKFYTLGTTFNSITCNEIYTPLSEPSIAGQIDGKTLYQYNLKSDINLWIGKKFDGTPSTYFDLTFTPQTTDVYSTNVNYAGFASGFANILIPANKMDFVSIQSIPEPATLVTLGVGAAIAAASVKRKEDSEE